MPSRPFVEAVSAQRRIDVYADGCGLPLDIPELRALALRSLVAMFDEKEKLFSRRVTLKEDGFHREGTSRRRTIIALLGLQRVVESGAPQPFDIASIQEVILGDTSWVESVGDLGLLTWFIAACAPERLETLFKKFDFGAALDTFSDGRQARTKEIAWFLTGIAYARLSGAESLPDLTDVAVDAYRLLQNNQSEGGIFGHAAFPRFLRLAFCRRFGTFADQIFAIYAFTVFAKAFQIEEPLESALSCANSVRALQGEMGQWWFLYDRYACRVVNRYPVCSRYQDGTAPVGLLALGEATGQSFLEPIYKGLSWVAGANELGCDLRDLDRGFIWDAIEPTRQIANYREAALSVMKISGRQRADDLRVRFEARPDHFGWQLYAFGTFGAPRPMTAAKAASAG